MLKLRVQSVSDCMRNPALRRVEVSFLAFSAAEQAAWIGVLVFAYQAGGVVEAALVAGIQLLPAVFAAPCVALASDRYRRDRVVAVSFVVQAFCMALTFAAMLGGAHRVVVYLASALVCVGLASTRPAVAALLPTIARDPEDLAAANAATSLFDNCGSLVGPLLAAVLLGMWGPPAVFAVLAVAMAAAAITLFGGVDGARSPHRAASDFSTLVSSVLGGVAYLRRSSDAWVLVVCVASPAIAMGALDVLVVAAAGELLGEADHVSGYLLGAFGFGGLMGAAAAVALVGRRRLLPAYCLGALSMGLPLAGMATVSTLAPALGLLFLSGVGESFAGVCGLTLIQRTTPDRVRGRVFGLFEGLYIAALSLGALSVSVVCEQLGLVGTFVAAGLLVPTLVAASLPRLRRIDAEAHPPQELVLRSLGVDPILASLPDTALRRLSRRAGLVALNEGTFVTREGEAGDRYYHLVEGELEVRVRDRVVRTLRAGDSLGEIAMLRALPRTASVIANTDTRLLALDRSDFLDALEEHEPSRNGAEAIVRERLGSHV